MRRITPFVVLVLYHIGFHYNVYNDKLFAYTVEAGFDPKLLVTLHVVIRLILASYPCRVQEVIHVEHGKNLSQIQNILDSVVVNNLLIRSSTAVQYGISVQ